MRVALVEIVGSLVEDIIGSHNENDDQDKLRKQLNGLYDLLLERTSDLSVYVRTKSLNVLAKLCELPVKFPKQRLTITTCAVGCLEDSSSLVRKAAIVLLKQLVSTHPYVMHGGQLPLTDWEAHYAEVVEQLAKVQGEVDKIVEGEKVGEEGDSENDEEDGEGLDADGEEREERRSKGKKKAHKRSRGDDEMDVDEEDGEGEGADEEDEDDEGVKDEDTENEDIEMDDGQSQSKKKARRRKSEINMEGLNDAMVVQALQGEELNQLKLKKRYYADGLSFIRQIEAGLKIVEDLLSSKSKAEVLEAMDLFRIVHALDFDGAEVSIICEW